MKLSGRLVMSFHLNRSLSVGDLCEDFLILKEIADALDMYEHKVAP